MGIHIEWLDPDKGKIGTLRMGENLNNYGDPYQLSATVQEVVDDGVKGLYISGASSNEKVDDKMSVLKVLSKYEREFVDLGYDFVEFERLMKDGTFRRVRLNKRR